MNKFKEITENILKSIGEQNKKLENLEQKIEKIVMEQVKEFLSSEDIIINDSPNASSSETLLLKGIENRLKELEEFKNNNSLNDDLNERFNHLEQENKKLKEKIIELEEKLKNFDDFETKLERLEENLKTIKENHNMNSIDTELKNANENTNDLAIKKDGKVVNIVINV